MKIALLHPGEMGAAIGAAAEGEVLWASEDRSQETRARAAAFRDVGALDALLGEAEVVLSICPPHAALDVARACAAFEGLYVDANAISPAHAAEIAALQPRFVDGGIVGGPGAPALYLSGDEAEKVASLFPSLETHVVRDASAVKMVYAAWSKGTAAMLLAIRDVAAHYGVEEEWRGAAPELQERLARAEPDGFHRAAAEVFRA